MHERHTSKRRWSLVLSCLVSACGCIQGRQLEAESKDQKQPAAATPPVIAAPWQEKMKALLEDKTLHYTEGWGLFTSGTFTGLGIGQFMYFRQQNSQTGVFYEAPVAAQHPDRDGGVLKKKNLSEKEWQEFLAGIAQMADLRDQTAEPGFDETYYEYVHWTKNSPTAALKEVQRVRIQKHEPKSRYDQLTQLFLKQGGER